MIATIETTDPAVLEVLQPVIAIVKNFKGYLNASYTKGRETRLDNIDKQRLYCPLHFMLAGREGFKLGTGSSHIYISYSTTGKHDIYTRVLLITDKP